MTRINRYLEEKKRLVDRGLERFLPKEESYPPKIHMAMRYSVFADAKRLRPVLLLAAAETGRVELNIALPAACAIELIHTFSLIHDDLPGLDNDNFRRGKPACHRAFGEDIAILAGDALLVQGFKLLGESERLGVEFLSPGILINEMADAIGTGGMIGGQVADLEAKKKKITRKELEYIHSRKTASLITAALRIGGLVGRIEGHELSALTDFGKAMGVSFQIADDLLDEKDKNRGSSYPALLGREKAASRVRELTLRAENALRPLGKKGEILKAINRVMVNRVKNE